MRGEQERALGYIRADVPLSTTEQKASIARFCDGAGIELVRMFEDDAESHRWSHPDARRDWFIETFQDVGDFLGKDGLLGVFEYLDTATDAATRPSNLIVARLDCLSSDLVFQEIIVSELRGRRVRVRSCDSSEQSHLDDTWPTDPNRSAIRRAVCAGMTAMFQLSATAQGAADREAEAVDDARDVGLLICELRLEYRGSLRSIARYLEHQQLKTRGGARWHPEAVKRQLERWRPFYLAGQRSHLPLPVRTRPLR